MTILLDNNTVIDALLERPPHGTYAKWLIESLAVSNCQAFVASKSITDIYYVMKKLIGAEYARSALGSFLCLVKVAPITETDIHKAFSLPIKDFEDAVIVSVAEACNADFIITQNIKDFVNSSIPAVTSEWLLRKLASEAEPSTLPDAPTDSVNHTARFTL